MKTSHKILLAAGIFALLMLVTTILLVVFDPFNPDKDNVSNEPPTNSTSSVGGSDQNFKTNENGHSPFFYVAWTVVIMALLIGVVIFIIFKYYFKKGDEMPKITVREFQESFVKSLFNDGLIKGYIDDLGNVVQSSLTFLSRKLWQEKNGVWWVAQKYKLTCSPVGTHFVLAPLTSVEDIVNGQYDVLLNCQKFTENREATRYPKYAPESPQERMMATFVDSIKKGDPDDRSLESLQAVQQMMAQNSVNDAKLPDVALSKKIKKEAAE